MFKEQYLVPFYKSNISYYETALILDEEGEVSFLFPIKKIIGVYSFGQDKEYKEGIDFVLTEKGTIKRLKGSTMPFVKFDDYYLDKVEGPIVLKVDNSKVNDERKKNKFFAFHEGDYFTSKQICITYEHDEIWNGIIPNYQGEKIKRFLTMLENKEKPTILFYGDSITVGCNASGTIYGGNVAPFMEPWPILVTNELKRIYGSDINYINTAVGGKDSTWAIESLDEEVIKHNPDLVIIAFGMNDGNRSANEMKKRILNMIERTMANKPETEFIVVSTTVPNPQSNWFFNEQTQHINEFKTIKMENVAIVDMTNTHLDLLKRKEFKDMTGNNVNHPNDFLIRIYAQMILGAILKER